MNVHKYLLAVVLGLGICGGISVEFAQGMNPAQNGQQQQVQVTCAQVIRDYIRCIKFNTEREGNVLAFVCNVKLTKDDKIVHDGKTIVVLKNGSFEDPERVKSFTKGEKASAYLIDQPSIYSIFGGFDAYCNNIQDDENIKSIKQKESKDYCKHTEVQYAMLKQRIRQGAIEIKNGDTTIKISNLDKNLYSMFEPCTSCCKIKGIWDNFIYFAIDNAMPGNQGWGQLEILPCRKWRSCVESGRKENEINWDEEISLSQFQKNDFYYVSRKETSILVPVYRQILQKTWYKYNSLLGTQKQYQL